MDDRLLYTVRLSKILLHITVWTLPSPTVGTLHIPSHVNTVGWVRQETERKDLSTEVLI